MRTVLGVSVGSTTARATALDAADDSVCSASVARPFESSGHVSAALELLDSMAVAHQVEPADSILAVPDNPAGRSQTSAYSMHQADRFMVVSELGAQLRFLRGTGQLEGLRTVAVCDVGASGTTVSVADPKIGNVFWSVRTTGFGGNMCDEAVRNYLLATYGADELVSSATLDGLVVAIRYAREQLSSLRVAEIPGPFIGGPVRLWRSTFEDIVDRGVRFIEDWIASAIVEAPKAVNALVLVGGCAHIPTLRRVLRRDLRLPVLVPAMPDSLTSHGAALLASDAMRRRSSRPLVAVGTIAAPAQAAFASAGYDAIPRHRTA
ncbi:Hsp70 family protein [Rhodococcus sp. G-MC3]|uniref:Hsp70 family protein n=1 Tax=Rhodococcus sp. G-MC3 TaxID=3046209 RepID=UPI0024BAA372|nr:Hsp70 family protein [Rhodococcus sp. G-MC3]MDJ0395611.1 Hsp70 family protein [Rhodococcus sp. G-MC3]